jgi:hypothetical protein
MISLIGPSDGDDEVGNLLVVVELLAATLTPTMTLTLSTSEAPSPRRRGSWS